MLVDEVAREHEFSGVVRVDRGDEIELAAAFGLANRAAGIPNRVDTRVRDRERGERADGARSGRA